MQTPLQITFHNMDHSPAVEARVRERAEKLDTLFDRITGCKVVIEAPHKHQRKGKLFNVRIDLTVPGKEIIANRDSGQNHAHEDVYVAIRDAFAAISRQLEDYARVLRGDVKSHEAPLSGKVVRIFPQQGYGFITTTDGQDIYFHENSVGGGQFQKLAVDSPVRLVIADGESAQGPQASTVTPIGKHHVG